jgi:hypothetical protein
MVANPERVRAYLRTYEFSKLFVDELGWDRLRSVPIVVSGNGRQVAATPIAEKRGMTVFLCAPEAGVGIPDSQTRRMIDRQLASAAREHIAIFVDSQKPRQVWQWVKRAAGETPAYRETWFHPGANGEALVQKVLAIEFQIQEEEGLTLTHVEERVRRAFDLDKVTKRFYEKFKEERTSFLKFVKGLRSEGDKAWYASLMISRLMFVYFIQKKHFLDGDPDYLRNRLATCRQRWGKDRFHSFYRHFLLRLFHEGLGKVDRNRELEDLLGRVPYLNGGLFEVHVLEERNPDIQIADEAFERLFGFFDAYQWHLDDRPLQSDNEINPDVLGFIFEKYINQKELGAYYTGKDITNYISSSTLIPYLLSRVGGPERGPSIQAGSVWATLRASPNRYFFEEGRHGISVALPPQVARGLPDPSLRDLWNTTASPDAGLPSETWREVVCRRSHFENFTRAAQAGEVASAEALIRWNLDLRKLILDFVEGDATPESIATLLKTLQGLAVLDPTCGSGAFLFSALNLIQEVYEACLTRMESFLAEAEGGERAIDPAIHRAFQSELTRIAQHPNRRYYVLKSSIVANLYGVDIMEEAAEICKLRLFLKIVAQVDKVEELEALPDIDFNIRVGNTLVGYSTLAEVRQSLKTSRKGQARLVSDDEESALTRIETRAAQADTAFTRFRSAQTRRGAPPSEVALAKTDLEKTLAPLEAELTKTLAADYGIDPSDKAALNRWSEQYQPFHWLVDFYGIMSRGGFDIVAGNPPYLEARDVEYGPRGFSTLESGAIHAMCVERSINLLSERGAISMIVPLSLVSTQRMTCVQRILEARHSTFYANFSWRPGKLFDGVNRALTIFISIPSDSPKVYSTPYQKWASDQRASLMHLIRFSEVPTNRSAFWVPKIGTDLERTLLEKLLAIRPRMDRFKGKREGGIYYRTTGGLYWKVFTDFAPGFKLNGKAGHSTRETTYPLRNPKLKLAAVALLSSDLFWWWYTVTSNCRDLNPSDIDGFPVPDEVLTDGPLSKLGAEYVADIDAHSSWLTRVQQQTGTTQTQSFKIQLSKSIIDRIDDRLARLYGLDKEQLDFLRSYDIKFRMSESDQEPDS